MKKKASNTSIYNITHLDYESTYEMLKMTPNKNIQSLDKTEKGHIICWFREPHVFVEISPKGKMNVYYDLYEDLTKVSRILEKLVICDSFSIERDIPRTLKVVQERIGDSDDFLQQLSSVRLKHDNNVFETESPKTFNDATRGIHKKCRNTFESLGTCLLKLAAANSREEVASVREEWRLKFNISEESREMDRTLR
jgi:hypothetical protein